MRSEALFINGVYEVVLQEILQIQSILPEQILFLQPYANKPMVLLQENPPSVDLPMRLFLSLTNDLSHVHYEGEVVGWEDKRLLSEHKRAVLTRIIQALQPIEVGLYDASPTGEKSVNLLYVRRIRKLDTPLSVEQLTKIRGDEPLSPGRTTSGGWAYVKNQAGTS